MLWKFAKLVHLDVLTRNRLMINISGAIIFVMGLLLFTKSVRDFIDDPSSKRAQKQNANRRIK